jgi:hypothetical protein
MKNIRYIIFPIQCISSRSNPPYIYFVAIAILYKLYFTQQTQLITYLEVLLVFVLKVVATVTNLPTVTKATNSNGHKATNGHNRSMVLINSLHFLPYFFEPISHITSFNTTTTSAICHKEVCQRN